MPSKPSLVSLFAGCGGSSLGYQAAGYDVRLAVEWDANAAATYRRNFPKTTVWEGDICDLSVEEALELAGVEPGELDVLDGSPPCQGFSTAGKRKFSDGRNRLFEEYVRLLEGFRPRAFVMENVSGLVKGKMKIVFAEMTAALKAAGYRVSCRLLNAWWYGVPQDRRRLIWVGMRDDIGAVPSHPAPTQRKARTVLQALDGVSVYTYWGSRGRSIKEKRPHSSSAAPTVAANQKLVVLADGASEPRYLSADEAKILQGFPDSFDVDEYRLIGNSVAPPMAEAVGRHVAGLLQKATRA